MSGRIASVEADSFEIIGGSPAAGVVLVCDHASSALPPAYGTLGLERCELERHIGWDIGAADVTRALAAALDAPAVLTRFSRLLIDTNRGLDDPTLIMRLSDGAIIPGNRHLDATERERRIERYWHPYHSAVARVRERCLELATGGRSPRAGRDWPLAMVGMHSFTHTWKGRPRPWCASVLWHGDPRLSQPLLAALRDEPGLVVGENEPYPGHYEGDTLSQHAAVHGLPNAVIEIRQDLIESGAGQLAWAERFARHLGALLRPGARHHMPRSSRA